jgi:hypothetical protein
MRVLRERATHHTMQYSSNLEGYRTESGGEHGTKQENNC